MPPEITVPFPGVQRRVEVAAPVLSSEVSEATAARARRRAASGEVSDPEEAETLAQLPGASVQNLSRHDRRKAGAELLSTLFRDGGRADLAAKVGACAPELRLSLKSRGSKWKVSTFSCYVRECPVCDARAAAERGRRLCEAVRTVQAAHPSMRWILLTLTVRNCALSDLRRTVLDLNAAWQRLSQRKDVSRYLIGWSRAVEVTRGDDGSAHPHAHVLLGVSPSYFQGKAYLSQERWRDLWRECARLDYDPVVDVRAIKKPSEAEGVDKLAGAVHEVTKAAGYSVKPSEMQFDDRWVCELHEQQSKLRFFSAGGEIKDALKALSDTAEEDEFGEDDDEGASGDPIRTLLFRYQSNFSQYRRSR